MFDYSIKTKAIVISALVILLIAMFFLINHNNSKTRDLEMVTQTRDLATSMEKYFEKNNSYPEADKIKLDNIGVISENGINIEGEYLYFEDLKWIMKGSLVSTKDRYIIEFDLNHSWEVWNLRKGGGTCKISNYLEMVCISN